MPCSKRINRMCPVVILGRAPAARPRRVCVSAARAACLARHVSADWRFLCARRKCKKEEEEEKEKEEEEESLSRG